MHVTTTAEETNESRSKIRLGKVLEKKLWLKIKIGVFTYFAKSCSINRLKRYQRQETNI